ncbi:MAG: TrkA family potassium uptake protein, partial [Eggerthellaceae bacterium]|nr:TrkA family potassium uptake protein [Eggerthellaceae bacterium]
QCDSPSLEGNFSVLELEIPLKPRRFDPAIGVRVGRIPMPEGSTISAVYRRASEYARIVEPELLLMPGDIVVVVAHNAVKSDVEHLFKGL